MVLFADALHTDFQINDTLELPDTDGGTQLAKLEKEVNGENVISLQIMLGSGSTFQLTPQLGILDLSSSADSETLESPDPVGKLLPNESFVF